MNSLKRELSSLHGYALMIGGMIGAGLFVVTGEAGATAGPSVPLGYVILLPILLASALSYFVFLSTPLGNSPGGAYIHISRTFNNRFVGFIFMWFQFIALIGVMSIMAISFANYVADVFGIHQSLLLATGLVLFFYIINVVGVKWFGRVQLIMAIVLLVSLAVLVIPGVFSIHIKNFTPLFPHGIKGLLKILPSLFFAYFGFEQLAQAGGEMKDSQKTLPKTMLRGAIITMVIYFIVSTVAFGVLPYKMLAASKSAMTDVAAVYLPGWGKWIVTIGVIMAFTTTLNSIMMVVSRMLLSFAHDRAIPSMFAQVNRRYRTPHVALTLIMGLVVLLLWTHTMHYLLNIALQGMFLLYIGHAVAMIALPYVRPALFKSALFQPSKMLLIFAGSFALVVLVYFSFNMILSVLHLLLIWTLVGLILFAMGKIEEKRLGVNQMKTFQSEMENYNVN